MEINGIPLHPLVVHAAVVLTPLAVLFGIAFAVRPSWRYLLRWPTALLAVAACGDLWIAKFSGQWFRDDLLEQKRITQALIDTHQARGTFLAWVSIAFLVLVVLGFWKLGGPSGFRSGRGAKAMGERWLELVLPTSIVVVGLVVLVWTILTGDAGARAVWG